MFLKFIYKWASLVLLLLMVLLVAVPAAAQPGGQNQAGLVVVHGDGRVTTRCVSFSEPEISGVVLLQRSGLLWQTSNGPMGAALCTLDGEGCPASDCFCKCKNAPCAYWNYFTGNEDASWTYSGVGVAARMLKNGDVDGWVWGDGSTGPSSRTLESICNVGGSGEPAVAEPPIVISPTFEPDETPTPRLSPTPAPTASSEPTLTAMPTEMPTPGFAAPVTQKPTATRTPELATAIPATATSTVLPSPTPTQTASPAPAATSVGERSWSMPVTQLGAFALVLGALASIYIIQRRKK